MTTPPSGHQIRLAAHDQEIVVVEVGGGLRSYRVGGGDGPGGEDIVDGYSETEMSDGGRGQLLAPWPNRLDGGSFEWEGRRFQTALTEVEAGNAIHGLVRWSNWVVPDSTPQPWGPQTPPDTTSLNYRLHPQPGWPWALDFRVTYRLVADHGLEVRTAVTNASDDPCPVGLGWHPYIAGPVGDCRLTLPAATTYDCDDRGIPRARRPVQGTDRDFRRPRLVGPARIDAAYTDIERDAAGRARVTLDWPGRRPVAVWFDRHYTHLMVYSGDTLGDTSRRRRGLAVEPMTCAPDMLRNHDGLRILGPGESFEATWGIDPFSNS
ncbi:MAG TPA: aldose 1-epimerase family protein [Acidimicrobiales bacterium]|nr:aldose 1-epimerase family protein [Acidimicrobiales bacterium]